MGAHLLSRCSLLRNLLPIAVLCMMGTLVLVFLRPGYRAGLAEQQQQVPITQQAQSPPPGGSSSCPLPSCLDALVVYHADDEPMMIKQGGLQSAIDHLLGVRTFFVLSASKDSFSHMPVTWIDERRAPFSRDDFQGSKRPPGWLYQQALKFWAVLNQDVEDMCNDVMVLDADILWLRGFDVRSPVLPPAGGWPQGVCPPPPRYKYNLASMDSGSWEGDIVNGQYHHFVNWLLGMPKVLIRTHTAINNWQVMQRDVLTRLQAGLTQRRGFKTIHEGLIAYGKAYNGMSEYEAVFSYVWTHYRDRVEPVYLPWVLQKPQLCDYNNKTLMKRWVKHSIIVYLTCHDNYGADPYWINCKGRDPADCDPDIKKASQRRLHSVK